MLPSASHTLRSLVGVVEQALGQIEAFVGPALVQQFAGQHQLQVAVLGIGLNRLLR